MSIEDSINKTVQEQVTKEVKAYFSRLISDNHAINEKLKWTEQKLNEALVKLENRNNILEDGGISGDKIAGGSIKDFSSTGIVDLAKEKKVTVNDHRVVVENDLEVKGTMHCEKLMYYKAKTDNLDVKDSVRIDGSEVLWKDRLGNVVTKSKLQEVGVLKELNVADTLTVYKGKVGINVLEPVGVFGVSRDGIEITVDVKGDTGFIGTVNSDPMALGTSGEPCLYVSHDNKIGIKIKRPKADLDVAGHIRYQGQTHQYLEAAPDDGTWSQGDIVWNSQPARGGVLGWVCVKSGAPGTWKSFVPIG
jgi:hypothetical protein